MDIFKKLKELNFPLGEYVLVGSGPLAARGIREASDLDIAVTPKLFKELIESKKYQKIEKYGKLFLEADNIDNTSIRLGCLSYNYRRSHKNSRYY